MAGSMDWLDNLGQAADRVIQGYATYEVAKLDAKAKAAVQPDITPAAATSPLQNGTVFGLTGLQVGIGLAVLVGVVLVVRKL